MRVTGDWIDAKPTQAVCNALTDAGYQAFFVGGCVRNALIDAPVADIDIATDALPGQVTELQKTAGFKVVPTGIDHGTVTVVARGIPHEITTFRRDVQTDGRHAVVAFSSDVAEDARRRDFTMNALYAGADGWVVDPLGGLDDLNARRVRFIEDPVQRIHEDYLRILRFFRFHAWYGDPDAGLDADGLAAIAGNLDGLDRLSRERVGAEMKKLLTAPDPAPSVAAMRLAGVLSHVLPGGDDKALAILVHLEGEHGFAPDPIRRLAVLGGQDVATNWRLSNAHARHLEGLRDGVENMSTPAALGYRIGVEMAGDILLLRAAVFETPFDPADMSAARLGEQARFPIKATDFMPDRQGAALGRHLKALEAKWIASGFTLTRAALLADPGEEEEST